MEPYFDTIPGKTTNAILPLLKNTNTYVSIGIAEKDLETGLAYNSAVLLGPDGIIGKYRKIGLNSQDQKIFCLGNLGVPVFDTPIGRIALALAHELEVPELGGIFCALRADIIAAPASKPTDLKVEINPKLYAIDSIPTGTADFIPYSTAFLNQLWVACGGYRIGDFSSAAIYGPEPVMLTPTKIAQKGQSILHEKVQIPGPGTWINQERLISGQQALWFAPLTK